MSTRDRKRWNAPREPVALWRWNGVLAIIIVIQICLAGLFHRDDGELDEMVSGGDQQDSVEALFVLTNRDQPGRLSPAELESLFASGNPRVQEWLFTTNLERLLDPGVQRRYLRRLEESPSAERARFFFKHGIRKTPWISLADLDAYLALPPE